MIGYQTRACARVTPLYDGRSPRGQRVRGENASPRTLALQREDA